MAKSFCQNLSKPDGGTRLAKMELGVPLKISPGKKLSVFVSRMIPEVGIEFLREKGVGVEINRQDRVLFQNRADRMLPGQGRPPLPAYR
jgi:hypothetical protein